MKQFIPFLLAVMVFAACTNNQFKGFEKTESGLYYKIYTSSTDTLHANDGDMMTVILNYRTLENQPVDSNYKSFPTQLVMRESAYSGDIYEGLKMLTVNDSATFVLSADSFFQVTAGSVIPQSLDTGSMFYLDVKITEIKTRAQMDQEQMAQMEEMKKAELDSRTKYLQDNNITVQPDSNGIYLVQQKKGNGKMVKTGNYVQLHLKISSTNGGYPLYNSTDHIAEGIELMVGTGYFGLGLDMKLQGTKVGDKFSCIVPSSMAFGERGVERIVPPYATLIYDCEILNVYTEDEFNQLSKKRNDDRIAKQKADMQSFAKKNSITSAPDADGIYKKVITEGVGEVVGTARSVSVHYTGTLLDGTKFDSSLDRGQPFTFIVGAGEVIPGWDKVVAGMKKGEKALVVIPSAMGYGNQAAGSIPPHSVLVFEIEVIDFGK